LIARPGQGAGPQGSLPAEVRRAAAAKLNLYLHVTGRRPDGYHLLDSLIAFAGVHDTVVARPSDDLTLAIEGPRAAGLTADDSNLVLRAARRLREAARSRAGAAMTLIKRLPVASGIGGGSADAAAALRALHELWGLDLPDSRLAEIALSLGADVPVCLAGRAAFIGGIGEQIAPAPALPAAFVVLANPGVAVSTPEVFAARQGSFSEPGRFRDTPRDVAALASALALRRNDLMNAALSLCPAVGRVVGALTRLPGCRLARMSGSGATCFGLFEQEAYAECAATDLRNAEPGWWVAAAPLLADASVVEPTL
jgi:4-diphosphocytidyl-2-C-methyl-D-erythritol kinase